VRGRPANARDREGNQQQLNDLDAQLAGGHRSKEAGLFCGVAFASGRPDGYG
jgi:hypothetical protein